MNTDTDTDIVESNTKQLNGTLEQDRLSRRAVLRGVLAAGCGLLLPAALFGCDAKKGAEPSGGATPAASPPASEEPVTPATTGKVTQVSVQYQAQPKGEQKCSGCQHFIAESTTCKLVEDPISPEGWCSLWAKKA